ncbi:MAG: hypothetical protein EOP24_42060 [Hyphomicrobiales bacterium]|nr:MAG: hypothetical protein EOP24_42060 [Hyphomicrobiales bacterium]
MAFSDDGGGFAFSCEDAKISICASTWNTRLSQLARIAGPVCIMTSGLPDIEYISRIVGKRPNDIFIIANTRAVLEAKQLKSRFPLLRIALHPNTNAKVVLIAPETVWVSSADFGKTGQIESAVGLHSTVVYSRTLESLFNTVWQEAMEIPIPRA